VELIHKALWMPQLVANHASRAQAITV